MSDKDSRDKLIEVATALFARKGFAGVSIREATDAAGVNSALISYYFGGKEGLYTTILERHFDQIREKLADVRSRQLDPLARIKFYISTVVSIHKQNPCLLRLLLGEITNPTPFFEPVVKNTILQISSYLRETFREGVSQGVFRAELNPEIAVVALAGMINFYFLSRPISADFLPLGDSTDEEFTRQAVTIFLSGVSRQN